MGNHASWYSGLTELSIVPPEYYFIVRIISGFFITLAIAFIIPVLALVVYDIMLWIWRLCSSRPSTVGPGSSRPSEAVDSQKPVMNGDTAKPGDRRAQTIPGSRLGADKFGKL